MRNSRSYTCGMNESGGGGGSGGRVGGRPPPDEGEWSRIPVAFRRSRSMRVRGERTPGGPCPRIAEDSTDRGVPPPPPPKPPNGHLAGGGSIRQRALSLTLHKHLPNGHQPNGRLPSSEAPRRSLPHHGDSPNTPPVSPADLAHFADVDDDVESVHSYSSSVATTASCDHHRRYVANNGTTFSGRKMKYVVHCSQHAGQTGDEYLTPTQRAQRQIRRLKTMLAQAKLDLDKKDSDIFRLTREVVELRLYKASLVSPDDGSNSSDAPTTVREQNTGTDQLLLVQTPESPRVADLTDDGPLGGNKSDRFNLSELHGSLADSGHFEDLASSSSVHSATRNERSGAEEEERDERSRLISLYERKIEEMARRHGVAEHELRRAHNDRVEAILQRLAEANARYGDLVPDHEHAKERIRDLERQLEQLSAQLAKHQERHHKMYLQMYGGGNQHQQPLPGPYNMPDEQEMELTHAYPRVSVPELLKELQITQNELDNLRDFNYSPERTSSKSRILLSAKEAVSLWVLGARKAMYKRIVEAQAGSRRGVDPEVTLQFLKSAIYYFLTDKENHQGHLRAIENILGFTEAEKENIQKARST